MNLKHYLSAVVIALLLSNISVLAAPQSFSQAKYELKKYVYYDQNLNNQEFYCGCNWKWVGRSGGKIDFGSCDYQVRAQENRGKRIEWEHVVPAHSLGHQRQCWQEGGRKNCIANDPIFRQMEAVILK
ncbi:endonuclease [Thiomicrospira pelophila]|uniref:endonuclease n=1 Tax=Thiomicrospira pelophila TaxID=934 RepID=UPI001FE0B501|nr:endonuclease [Thiomicrospira pelophila]